MPRPGIWVGSSSTEVLEVFANTRCVGVEPLSVSREHNQAEILGDLESQFGGYAVDLRQFFGTDFSVRLRHDMQCLQQLPLSLDTS